MAKVPMLPTSLPGGEMLPHMSARYRTSVIDTLFEATGGHERAKAWIEHSNENYGEFFKIWSKGAAKAVSHELGVSEGVESLLDKLDQEERAKTIEGSFKEVGS